MTPHAVTGRKIADEMIDESHCLNTITDSANTDATR
jgi:hypothetical protein